MVRQGQMAWSTQQRQPCQITLEAGKAGCMVSQPQKLLYRGHGYCVNWKLAGSLQQRGLPTRCSGVPTGAPQTESVQQHLLGEQHWGAESLRLRACRQR